MHFFPLLDVVGELLTSRNAEQVGKAHQKAAALGLSVSDTVRLLLRRIAVEKALPFEVRIPNAETRDAMREADEIVRAHAARFAAADDLLSDLKQARIH
ncbi:MAG: type II toxin-antitoxin system RelB/DinJ family antitoxin [Alphaproteobacteria bacterium]|nr:MAG: type II toxin-antitoxin system RelB/DinJ family antitoxin [Alphaproteobacteria bacterium]